MDFIKEKIKQIRNVVTEHRQKFILGGIGLIIVIVCIVVLFVQALTSKKADRNDINNNKMDETQISEDVTIGDIADNDPQSESLAVQEGDGQEVLAAALEGSNAEYSNGIDVSRWQGKIDWSSVAASGIDFAMIRVGYRTDDKGTIVEDPYAAYNLQRAQAAGVQIGVYFFSTAVNEDEAIEEALWTTSYIAKYSITYPVVYNCEGYTASDSRMYGLSNNQRSRNAIAFLDTVSQAGYQGMFYASKSELENNQNWNTVTISRSYPIWVASYESTYPAAEKPSYSGACNMWQYTNKGVVSGVSGYVDLNVAYFSYDSVAAPKDTSGKVVDANTAELGLTFENASDSVTAKEETNLRSEPNTASSVVATIMNGTYVDRTGISDSGWSRVIYNGQTCYAYSQLLTTETVQQTTAAPNVEAGVTFSSVSESVTAKEETNLRTAPSFDGIVAASITNGTVVTRTGVGDNGWSRVVYNGTTYYAVTSYLTTDLNPSTSASEGNGSNGTSVVDGQTFTAASGRMTAKEETNLRTSPTTEGSTVVATIQNGEYVERTGTGDMGWTRLIYNGQIVYAITSYLTE